MKRKLVLLLLFIVIMLIVTGCWNRRELNDLAIAVAMGIDKSGDQYKVSYQVVDPGEVAAQKGTGATPVVMYSSTGETLFQAIRRITAVAPRKIYSAHLRIVVISETLAKEGIGKTLDFLLRDHELRTDFFIVIAKGTSAENTMKVLTNIEKIPALKMESSIKLSEENWAPTVAIQLDELIFDIISEGKHPVLTGIQIKGEKAKGVTKENVELIDSPAELQYSGLAVFNKDKLIGWLNEEESRGYTYIADRVKSTVGVVPCPGGKLTVEVIRSKTKVKGRVEKGKPQIDVETRMEVNVGEVACQIDLTKTKTVYELEKKGEQLVQKIMETSINKVQNKFKVDVFGFGEVIHRSDPKAWKKMKKDWDKTFVDIPVNVKVDIKIRRLGTVNNSFLEEMKE